MLLFGLWCLAVFFGINLIGGLFGAGAKFMSKTKDAELSGCVTAIVSVIIHGFGIWIALAAISALS